MKLNKSLIKTLFVSVLAFILFSWSCEPPTKAETTGDIQGIIYDASSSQPLGGATITTEPITSSKITDSNGSFKLEGVEPGDYTLQVTKSGYQTNSTTVNVVAGETASADLQLTAVAPQLSVSVTSLDFGSTSSSLPFTISNTGEGALEWSVSENSDWISVNPTSGNTTDNQSSVTVSVSRTGLDPGDFSETVTITSNGGSATIQINLTVEGPVLVLSNNSLNFGTVTDNLTFTVTNGGIGTVTYNAVYTAAWLTVNPTSGSATTETDVINVSVDRSGLAYGNYFETVTITSNANSATVDVMMTVPDPNNPQLSAYPSTVDFGSNSTEETFNITNTGSGMLTWNITDDKSWISVSPQSGTTEAETDEIIVTIDRLGQSPGTYTGIIMIASDGGNQNISVSMTIPDEPSLSVAPSSLDFGTSETIMSFNIANAGTGDLNWSVADNQEWISTNPSTGTNYGTINVTVSRDGMTAGDYSGTVTVSSNGGTGYVEIYLNVPADDPPAEIELLSPSNVTENSLTLNWTRNFDSDFAAYKVYRDISPAVTQSSELLSTITISSENYYTDTGLQASTTYYYRVYAMDMANQHTASNIVNATTLTQLGNWSVNTTLGATLYSVDGLSESFIYAVGLSGVLYFHNGTEWSEETHPSSNYIYEIDIFSQTDIWTRSYTTSINLYHYDGITWSLSALSGSKICIEIVSSDNVYVGGSNGDIHHYDGTSWTTTTVDAVGIVDIQMDSADSGWAVDGNGKIFYYNGFGWSVHDITIPGSVSKFLVFNTSDIWALGSWNFRHWDGVDWTEFDLPDYYDISDYHSFSSNAIWFVGGYSGSYNTDAAIIRYWDGNEMLEITSPTSEKLYGIYMMSETDGWAVGYNGVVLRYH